MAKRLSPMLFEVFDHTTREIVGVYSTFRRASNAAGRRNKAGEGMGHSFVRRMVPMHPADLFEISFVPAVARILCEHLQRSGFWQPLDYDRYTHRYLYW